MAKKRAKTHRDVDFEVHVGRDFKQIGDEDRSFKRFDDAAAYAVDVAISGREAFLDVVVWSRAGAKWLGGEDAVERYEEDPETSVFERIEVKANVIGRVP